MLCPGCFQKKNETAPICPHCEFDTSKPRSPLVLPYYTVLHEQFIVGKVLGKPGGFGITYLGWDTQLETAVAIKEYLPRDLAGREHDHLSVAPHTEQDAELFRYGIEQFIQEARTIAKINHPNVVRVRYFFKENGTSYLVMDYYEGVALPEYLDAAGGKIPEQLAVGIMLRILDGLKEVHAKGFLHRDIKPQNIYLTNDGKPILLDMGAARAAVGDKNRSLSVLYSSGFTPFEQYYRRGDQGTWTDIYACGATLYYILTGVIPPDAPGRLGEDELIHPCQLEPTVSASVAGAVLRALDMDPSKRPQTAQEFQTLLLTALEVSVAHERDYVNPPAKEYRQDLSSQVPDPGNKANAAHCEDGADPPIPAEIPVYEDPASPGHQTKPLTVQTESPTLAPVSDFAAEEKPEPTAIAGGDVDSAAAVFSQGNNCSPDTEKTEPTKDTPSSFRAVRVWLLCSALMVGLFITVATLSWSKTPAKPTAAPPVKEVQQTPVVTRQETVQTQAVQTPIDLEVLRTVNLFYTLIETRQYREAYFYLSADWHKSVPLATFMNGYQNTISSKLAKVEYLGDSPALGTAKVWVRLFARDRAQGRIMNQTFEGELLLVKEAGIWRINESNLKVVSKTFE